MSTQGLTMACRIVSESTAANGAHDMVVHALETITRRASLSSSLQTQHVARNTLQQSHHCICRHLVPGSRHGWSRCRHHGAGHPPADHPTQAGVFEAHPQGVAAGGRRCAARGGRSRCEALCAASCKACVHALYTCAHAQACPVCGGRLRRTVPASAWRLRFRTRCRRSCGSPTKRRQKRPMQRCDTTRQQEPRPAP